MSFDIKFDYQTIGNVLQQNITTANTKIGIINDKMVCTENFTGNIAYLQSTGNVQCQEVKTNLQSKRGMYQDLLSKVNGIINFETSDKATLYNFWNECSKVDVYYPTAQTYEKRMIFHANEMISDASNVLSELHTLTTDDKYVVYDTVCNKYDIHANVAILYYQLGYPPPYPDRLLFPKQ
jgi:hypothetical protein